jgi:hypothetical protein
MATAIASRAQDAGEEPAKLCKCGCRTAIARSRVFVSRDHQVTWLRAEGAKRRARNSEDTSSSALPPAGVAESSGEAPAPIAVPAADERASRLGLIAAVPFQTSHDMRPIEITRLRPAPRKPDLAVANAETAAAKSVVEPPSIESPMGGPAETSTDTEELPLSFAGQLYTVGFIVSALPAFCLTWMYCVAAYGTPGAALGWLPALVISAVTGATWPGLVIAVLAVALTQIV